MNYGLTLLKVFQKNSEEEIQKGIDIGKLKENKKKMRDKNSSVNQIRLTCQLSGFWYLYKNFMIGTGY